MTASQSRAAWPSTSSSSGKTRASGCASRWSRRASAGSVIGRVDRVDLHAGGGRAHPRVGHVGADPAALGLGCASTGMRRLCTHVRRRRQECTRSHSTTAVHRVGQKGWSSGRFRRTMKEPAAGSFEGKSEERRCHDEPPSCPTACRCCHAAATAAPARARASWRWPPSSRVSGGATTRRARIPCWPRWRAASTTCSTRRTGSAS